MSSIRKLGRKKKFSQFFSKNVFPYNVLKNVLKRFLGHFGFRKRFSISKVFLRFFFFFFFFENFPKKLWKTFSDMWIQFHNLKFQTHQNARKWEIQTFSGRISKISAQKDEKGKSYKQKHFWKKKENRDFHSENVTFLGSYKIVHRLRERGACRSCTSCI